MNHILYSVHDRICSITLNRPHKRNALNHELVSELKQSFSQAEEDEAVKVIILKANGESFCAGADLAYLQQLQNFSYEENLADSNHLKELFLQIYQLKKVVIAEVQGHALAGGCGLATVCDFVYAVPEAKFGYTEVKIGFVPAIVMVFLLRKIGEQRAKQLLLSGELISAEAAMHAGLITQVVPAEALSTIVLSFAQKLAKNNSAQSMALTKQMIADVQSLPLQNAVDYAAQLNARARASEDCKRGIQAFINKEELRW